jgi:hypothetical protein
LDRCNEQSFLRKKSRIRKDTWNDWCLGVEAHLRKPTFKAVWEEVKEHSPGSFSFLEKLEHEGFEKDPQTWQ